MFTIIALSDEFSGALAYALEHALQDPATIRVVRVGPPSDPDRVLPPIPVDRVEGDLLAGLRDLSERSDLLIVQSPPDGDDHVLVDLRRNLACLLVEVDAEGQIHLVSGPEGSFYAAAIHHPETRPKAWSGG